MTEKNEPPKPAQVPAVCRMVVYCYPHDIVPRAAIVTRANEQGVWLSVFTAGANGSHAINLPPYSETPTPGCWSWPARG